MPKITLIGAGSVGFTRNLLRDLLHDQSLRENTHLTLMDISEQRLGYAMEYARIYAAALQVPLRCSATTDLSAALDGADYVVTVIRTGELQHQIAEYEIPLRYGVDQVVADTLGPGGVFRGLRALKALFPIIDAMEEHCPGAYLFNYVNPMSINTIALSRRARTVQVFGLCHGVQATARLLARFTGVPFESLRYLCAGVNHQAFMLKLEAAGVDLYPRLRELMDNSGCPECQEEKVRFEIMRHFDYFPTESSGHASEYLPYFRKRQDLLDKFCSCSVSHVGGGIDYGSMVAGISGAAIEINRQLQQQYGRQLQELRAGKTQPDLSPSPEYAMRLVSAIENNIPYTANLNVINHGLMPSLPPECSVEVPCLVNGAGINPCRIENYPEPLAALNRGMINVQMLAAEGALNCDRRRIMQAIALDPLTAAVCSLAEIQQMTDALFSALRDQVEARFFS
ncbi:MAG: alpha-glucosidase/alpha-galactosidase [Oligosphaeraceae bacterium]|nr:alpha-glucosidase/alpha-galactosidase [Oligosphaeraceae bacterium]